MKEGNPDGKGNPGTVYFKFDIVLSEPSTTDVTVSTITKSETATTDDYADPTSTLVTIPAGTTTTSFVVSVIGDLKSEKDETFIIYLSSPVGAKIIDESGLGTIINDDE